MPKNSNAPVPIQSTAGAVPVKNEKGQVSMQKVKVSRYVSGKRPEYAPRSSSEDESEDEEFVSSQQRYKHESDEGEEEEEIQREDLEEMEKSDPRLRRLLISEPGPRTRRRVEEPEILDEDRESEDEDFRARRHDSESESEEEELDDKELEKRRAYLRQRALEKRDEEELLAKEEEKETESEDSESEYEEYTDSEEEARPRLKPVFVRKDERITVKEKDNEEVVYKQVEEQTRVKKEERRKETLKILEDEIRRERGKPDSDEEDESEATMPKITDVNTDEENEEAEYEAWKIRELKRLKKSRDERDAFRREQMEIERMHNLTDEERRLEMKLKPKHLVNKAMKGKYKFLQKYYHRGVFFLDKDDDVYKRDFSQPTLEDHFDKTILPKVMQVKNFGRSGRTKYTHLVDQDTTNFDSAWASDNVQTLKFHTSQAAGIRQVFQKPTFKRGKGDTDN